MPEEDVARIEDDRRDLYGERYWFDHQSLDFGYPDIQQRARADLPERCTHWLRALLRFKLPPARVLEMGSAHGGFVALLRQAGFVATGLELSPAIVALARRTFDVPMLQGPIEAQSLAPASFDVIALFDVLEHLQDPPATLRRCLELLAPDGILLVQTPRVRPEKTFADLVGSDDAFLAHFKPREHLFLFTEDGARELVRRVGAGHVAFLPAIFAHYDMFFVAGREPLSERREEESAAALQSPSQRIALALVDLHRRHEETSRYLASASRDAEERLRLIETLDAQLRRSEADRAERLRVIEALAARLHSAEGPPPPSKENARPAATISRWLRALVRRAGLRASRP
jgi:2-polyprenyl-3-methyl-5-hydroxy-6-metoxy-1,4-benzoquinol methylase